MFDTLFGAEMPLAVRFFLAFLIVLGLIGATAWAVRRFGTGRLGANTRGRQPRLAVIDHAAVDGRRRLILVRRDNVEHLLMIGGPTDVVVEPNIVRAVAAPRDLPTPRPSAGLEALPRAVPLPESGSNGTWPLQPEPAAGPRPAVRVEPLPEELPRTPAPHAEAQQRPQRDTLTALADELSTAAVPPLRGRPSPFARPQPDKEAHVAMHGETHVEAHAEIPVEAYPEPPLEPRVEFRPEPRAEHRIEPRADHRAEPRLELRPELRPELRTELRKPIAPPAAPAPPSAPVAATEADQSLTDMAQRLEAALRKPNAELRAPLPPPRPAVHPEATAPVEPAPPRAARPGEPKPARPEAKQSKTTLYDSLEQEMASLLGRQNKT